MSRQMGNQTLLRRTLFQGTLIRSRVDERLRDVTLLLDRFTIFMASALNLEPSRIWCLTALEA